MLNIGPAELIVILLLALIVFGPRRLPEIGRTVGKSLREFRRASAEIRDELSLGLDDEPTATTAEERSRVTRPAGGNGAEPPPA